MLSSLKCRVLNPKNTIVCEEPWAEFQVFLARYWEASEALRVERRLEVEIGFPDGSYPPALPFMGPAPPPRPPAPPKIAEKLGCLEIDVRRLRSGILLLGEANDDQTDLRSRALAAR
jgi:hypothetical protein